jgi:hypothetical protein
LESAIFRSREEKVRWGLSIDDLIATTRREML